MELRYIVDENTKYKTLKSLLKNYFYVSDRLIVKLKQNHRLIVNNEEVYINKILNFGDNITINIDFEEECDVIPTKMNLNILYEDECILVVDKGQKMAVHPSQNHFDNSLANGVKYYFDEIGLKRKIRPVNRLDKDTFGIVIFAKNEYVQECLSLQRNQKEFIKKYIGIVEGKFPNKEGKIVAPISRKPGSIIEREINENGEYAVTYYKVLEEYEKTSLIEFTLETGRTHQIRVHCKYIGCPLVGDGIYGNEDSRYNGQQLIAYKIEFIHPLTRDKMEIISKISFQK